VNDMNQTPLRDHSHVATDIASINPKWMCFLNGVANSIIGVYSSLRNPNVFREYTSFLKPLVLIAGLLYMSYFAFLLLLFPVLIVFPGILLQLLTLIPYTSYQLVLKWSPEIGDKFFVEELKSLNIQFGNEIQHDIANSSKGNKNCTPRESTDTSNWSSLDQWKYFVALSVFSIIPVIGPLVAYFGGVWIVSYLWGWQLLAPYTVSVKKMNYQTQERWMRERKWAILGSMTPLTVLMSIPLIGPLFIGFAQSGSSHLFYNIFCEKQLNVSDQKIEYKQR